MSLTSCVLDNPIQITIVIVRPAALSKNDQIWPKIGIFVHFGPGLAGSFGALLVGWLVVVARGLYLARHLFTLYILLKEFSKLQNAALSLTPTMTPKNCY